MSNSTIHNSNEVLRKTLTLIVVVVPFLGVLYAIYTLWMQWVTPLDVTLMVLLWLMTGHGITIGYHRMLTHQSFETYKPIKALWIALGCMAIEGGPQSWVLNHAEHHAKSDKEGDPHSPLDGLWHSHVGWMFKTTASDQSRYAPWIVQDRMAGFFERSFLFWAGLSLVLPFSIGYMVSGGSLVVAFQAFVWGGLVRVFMTHHITWSVNSICHSFGSRMFRTTDESRNNLIVGILALGEGWHNNHHAYPRSADHGMRWWQIDTSSYIIRLMERLGLVWNVHRIPAHIQQRKLLKT